MQQESGMSEKVASERVVGATLREVGTIKKPRKWPGRVFLLSAVAVGTIGLWWSHTRQAPSSPSTRHDVPVKKNNWTSPTTGMEFVWIQALGLWVGKYEVTNGEYRKMDLSHDSEAYRNAKTYITHDMNGDRQPVVVVNFRDARKYAEWLTKQDQEKLGGMHYRVPSQKEFMTYVQCGDDREYPWGNTWPPTSGQAGNYWDETAKRGSATSSSILGYDDGYIVTCDVEKSWENPWKLFGVGGNAWEVCASDKDASLLGAWCGAAWFSHAQIELRCSYRYFVDNPDRYISGGGFRLVLSLP